MFVYVISDDSGHHKVGIASDVAWRLADLQIGNALRLRVVHSVETMLASAVERYAHWLLREHHVSGEWFRAAEPAVISAVTKAHAAVLNGERASGSAISARRRHKVEEPTFHARPQPVVDGYGCSTISDALMRRRASEDAYRRLVKPASPKR